MPVKLRRKCRLIESCTIDTLKFFLSSAFFDIFLGKNFFAGATLPSKENIPVVLHKIIKKCVEIHKRITRRKICVSCSEGLQHWKPGVPYPPIAIHVMFSFD